jgi:hypothetical protein
VVFVSRDRAGGERFANIFQIPVSQLRVHQDLEVALVPTLVFAGKDGIVKQVWQGRVTAPQHDVIKATICPPGSIAR